MMVIKWKGHIIENRKVKEGDRAMKFIRFQIGEVEKLGIFNKTETEILEIAKILGREFTSMINLIEEITEEELKKLKETESNKKYKGYYTKEVKLCSPIKKTIHDIVCVGVNYRDHLEETQKNFDKNFSVPQKTVYFSKRAIEIIGPGDTVKSRMDLDEKLDYEVELAVVIGKRGTDIPKEKVEEYIFGYSVFNDISARELQGSHVQWYRGKSLDSFSSMGPVILHKSSLPFPVEVDIRSYVNGEIRQTSNTKLFLSNIGEIISEISSGITLEAGDIVITGTPSGVGLGLKPQKFMKKGDIVVCEIPEIGRLENIIG